MTVQAVVAAGVQLAPGPAAAPAAAHTLAVLSTVTAQVSVFAERAAQRALPAPAVAGIDVAKRPGMHYTALADRCWSCFGLAIARMAHILEEQCCLAVNRRAAL